MGGAKSEEQERIIEEERGLEWLCSALFHLRSHNDANVDRYIHYETGWCCEFLSEGRVTLDLKIIVWKRSRCGEG